MKLPGGRRIQLRNAAVGARGAASLVLAFAFAGILAGIAVAAPASPVNTGDPTITGTAEVGSTLSAAQGSWTGDPAPTYSYQWQRCAAVVTPVVTTPFNSGATLDDPRGIAVDSAGNVYTANTGNNTVSKFLPDGSLAGGNWPVTVGAGPEGIAVDSAGNVYTANYRGNSVTKITPAGVASTLPIPDYPSPGNPVNPISVTTDSAGNVYTANNSAGTVSKILPDFTLATSPWPVATGDGPYDSTVDSAGNLYTPNSNGNSVTKITPDGVPSTLAIPPSSSFQNAVPLGVTTDSAGNVYTANSGSATVSKILPGFTLAPAPWPVTTGSSSSQPSSIATDPAGNIYTANRGNDRVTKISSDGLPGTLARSSDGLDVPWDIATDPLGNVFVVNNSGENVTKITQVPCADITGATASSYSLVGADEGKRVRVIVTASNGVGTAVIAASAPTATVGPDTRSAPANTAAPTISGTAEVGSALTADRGTWTGNPTPTYAYQWQRCDTGGNDCTDIAGAAFDTYIPASADEGKKLRVKVSATNSQGSSEALSAAVGPVPVSPGPAPTPPGPTPGPDPSPSLRVESTKVRSKGQSVVVRVQVSGAGRVGVVGSTASSGASRVRVCRSSRSVTQAGVVTVTCRLNRTGRVMRTMAPLRIRLGITYVPSSGETRTATRVVRMAKTGGRPDPVTG